MALIVIAGIFLFMKVYQLSNKYGEHGMLKKMAKRNVPGLIKNNSRIIFTSLAKS